MSIFDKIGRRFGLMGTRQWGAFFGRASAAGEMVTPETALQLATVWACVRLNSTAVGAMPVRLYEKGAKGGRVAIEHDLNAIIGESPNADMTSQEFWEAMVGWLMLQGNAYAEIDRDEKGRVLALNILPADQVQVVRDQFNDLRYKFTDRGKPVDLPADRVLHLRAFSFGGDLGLSPIYYGAQVLGSAIAADKTAAATFANGMQPSGFFEFDTELTEEQREQVQKNMIAPMTGASNRGHVGVLESGVKWHQVSIDPQAVQMLETRRFNVEEICRMFSVPPIMVSHAAQGQTMWGSGVEAILLQHMTMGLNPLLTRIERRIVKQLLPPGERSKIYPRFNRESMLQMDSTAKASFISSMVQNGVYNRARARELMDEPYIEGTDGLTVQSNLTPLDKLGATDPRAAMRNALGLEESE